MADGNLIEGNSLAVVYSKASGNVYQTVGGGAGKPHTSLLVPELKSQVMGDIVPWGADNMLPQRVLKEIRKNTIIGPTLKKQAEFAYDEVVYGFNEPEAGVMKFYPQKDKRTEAFFRRSLINRYTIKSLRSFYYWYFAVPEFAFTADRSEVYSIRAQTTAHFRFQKQDNWGRINHGYLCADWESIQNEEDKKFVSKVPLIDIYGDPLELKEEGRAFKYIYPLSYPTEDEIFYPLVDWNTARESGWLEVAQSIPKFKKALFKNQITMKYLIQVPSWWWEWKYPGFENKTEKKRKEIQDHEIDLFEKFTKGEDSAGSSLMVTFVSDPRLQKEYQGWKIEAIDNKIKDGIYIEDSNEASSHLLYALSMDPTIIGSQPGSKLGGGSGSDKRVAFNIYIDTVKAHQDLILEPLRWIADYNGWEPYTFKFKNSLDPANTERATQESKSALKEPQQQAS